MSRRALRVGGSLAQRLCRQNVRRRRGRGRSVEERLAAQFQTSSIAIGHRGFGHRRVLGLGGESRARAGRHCCCRRGLLLGLTGSCDGGRGRGRRRSGQCFLGVFFGIVEAKDNGRPTTVFLSSSSSLPLLLRDRNSRWLLRPIGRQWRRWLLGVCGRGRRRGRGGGKDGEREWRARLLLVVVVFFLLPLADG